MRFNVTKQEQSQSKIPHDLFLVNLIGNHILAFVATLGLASSWAWPMLIVPITSISILAYIMYRGNKALKQDTWFVKCHWQLTIKRSKTLIIMLLISMTVVFTGVILYTHYGVMKEAAYAFIGGVGLLPIMVTVLILIIMESDALHQASLGELPQSIIDQFPEGQYPEKNKDNEP